MANTYPLPYVCGRTELRALLRYAPFLQFL